MSGVRDPFSRLVLALQPWLAQLVIIGGWAHRLYRRHPAAQELDYPPLMTLDTDVAMPLNLPAEENAIRSRLLAHGFAEEFMGDERPPATHYHLRDEASGFYVEFLAPLVGGRYDRKGKRKTTAEIGGVAFQRLRHVELLLHHPWSIEFESDRIFIANPVSFIAQKVLIQKERGREDRAKDVLYMYDTLQVFGSRLPDLQELWRRHVASQLHTRNARIIRKASEVLFASVSDDILRAARISDQRQLSPESIREACHSGFAQVFN